jgi:epsilon-lactone hydrolase
MGAGAVVGHQFPCVCFDTRESQGIVVKTKKSLLPVVFLVLIFAAASPGAHGAPTTAIAADGELTLKDATLPLSGLLSEGGKRVLMRARATEGPGAPVPPPSDISDMKELRRVYNENLKPNVAHMREVFPVQIEESVIDGISVAVVTPQGGVPARNRNRLVLNGPGGGFRTGVRGNGLLISIPMAATLGVKVVSIIYRQGPEFRFPAASEDLLKVWNHFTKTYKPKNIGLLGCSAGGALVTQTTAMLIKAGRPTPGVLGVYCSGLGAGPGGDSQLYGSLAVTSVRASTASAAAAPAAVPAMTYFTGIDMSQFVVNPTLDEQQLAKFPPAIFFTATRDAAMSSAAYSYRKLLKLDIDSQLMIFDGLYHGFMTNPDFPESQEGYRQAAKFFDQHLGH